VANTVDHPAQGPLPEPFTLPTERLEAAIVALAGEAHNTRYRLLKLLAEYDQRGAWAAWGATSCAVWWADVADLEPATAREHLRVARALDELPALDAALADQRLSYAKVKVISRLAEPDTVDELVALASSCAAARLPVLIAAWTADHLSPEALAEAQHQARSITFRTEPDGMVTTTIRQRPTDAAALRAAIDQQVMAGDAPAGASLAQLRVDALHRLIAGGSTGRTSAEVDIHVHRRPNGALVATLADGTPVPEPEVGEILCEATVRALVHDSDGRPIDASPGRPGPNRRQRRLLRQRDHHCQHRRCRARAFLHVHHVIARDQGGPTIMANLVLLCSFHHRLLHRSPPGWRPDWWTDRHEAVVRRAMHTADHKT
jgi:hypothetical protein